MKNSNIFNAYSRSFLFILILIFSGASWATQNIHPLGMNAFHLAMQYQGYASGGKGQAAWQATTAAMGAKSILDARDVGAGFMRVAVAGYGPDMPGQEADLERWRNAPAQYWANLDHMMRDLRQLGLKLVPVLMWNSRQFPAMTGETVHDLIARPDSQARALLARYAREFIARYRNDTVIDFYELTNELNLLADIDVDGKCKRKSGNEELRCAIDGNYSTEEMNAFIGWLSGVVRTADPTRKISSGFSIPRGAAWHLQRHPGWSQGGPDWTVDTPEQLRAYLLDIHKHVDIISIHLYPGKENQRFGEDESALLARINAFATSAGKALYVGEFGDPDIRLDRPDNFVIRILHTIEKQGVAYASPWVFEFYQSKPHLTYDSKADNFNLEPGYTDRTLAVFRNINCRISTAGCKEAVSDTPKIVLTWPLQCSRINGAVEVFAVASDAGKAVDTVSFGLDDHIETTMSAPPYHAAMDVKPGQKLPQKIFVRACNQTGCAEDSISVNSQEDGCHMHGSKKSRLTPGSLQR